MRVKIMLMVVREVHRKQSERLLIKRGRDFSPVPRSELKLCIDKSPRTKNWELVGDGYCAIQNSYQNSCLALRLNEVSPGTTADGPPGSLFQPLGIHRVASPTASLQWGTRSTN